MAAVELVIPEPVEGHVKLVCGKHRWLVVGLLRFPRNFVFQGALVHKPAASS